MIGCSYCQGLESHEFMAERIGCYDTGRVKYQWAEVCSCGKYTLDIIMGDKEIPEVNSTSLLVAGV